MKGGRALRGAWGGGLALAMLAAVFFGPRLASLWFLNLGGIAQLKAALSPGQPPEARRQHLAAAEGDLRQALAWDGANGRAWLKLGQLYLAEGQPAAAIQALSAAVSLHPQEPLGHFWLGRAFQAEGRWAEAVGEWRAAAAGPYFVRLGDQLRQRGAAKEAVEAYGTALEIGPESFEAYLGLGLAYQQSGAWGEAKAPLEAALRLRPRDPESRVALARTYDLGLRDYAQAIREYQAALALGYESAWVYLFIAGAYRNLGQPERAVEWYRHGQALDPASDLPWVGLGFAYLDLGQPQAALEAFQGALSRNPSSIDAAFGLARAYRALGRLDEAATQYRRVLATEPRHALAAQELEQVLRELPR